MTVVIPELQDYVVGGDDGESNSVSSTDGIIPGSESNASGLGIPPEGIDLDSDSGDSQGNSEPKQNREARYRVERNEARQQRDELAQQVELLQRREAERIAAKHLSHGADVFTLSGRTVKDFTDPKTGEINADLVIQTANEILGTRPGLRPNEPAVDRSQGSGGDGPIKELSWTGLFDPH